MATRVWLVFVICSAIINDGLSEELQQLKNKIRSPAVVVGTVYCDTCFKNAFSESSGHSISGASVAVECVDEISKRSFREEAKTDGKGKFKVKLPFYISRHAKNIKTCSVKLLKSPQPYCSLASSSSSSSLRRLNSRNRKARMFSAGILTFKPQNLPGSRQPIDLVNSKSSLPGTEFPPPIKDPSFPDPSPIPLLPSLPPLPLIPSLPPLPPISSSSQYKKTDARPDFFFFPPIPFVPPPSVLPPLPFQPPPPSVLPPLPFQPPPPQIIPPLPSIPTLPPVPGLNPPSPPPPPPSLPIPLPPIFPGIPPASSRDREP